MKWKNKNLSINRYRALLLDHISLVATSDQSLWVPLIAPSPSGVRGAYGLGGSGGCLGVGFLGGSVQGLLCMGLW